MRKKSLGSNKFHSFRLHHETAFETSRRSSNASLQSTPKKLFPQAKEQLSQEPAGGKPQQPVPNLAHCSQSKVNLEYSRLLFSQLSQDVRTSQQQSIKIEGKFNFSVKRHNKSSSSLSLQSSHKASILKAEERSVNLFSRKQSAHQTPATPMDASSPSSDKFTNILSAHDLEDVPDPKLLRQQAYKNMLSSYDEVTEKDKLAMGDFLKNPTINQLLSKSPFREEPMTGQERLNSLCLLDASDKRKQKLRSDFLKISLKEAECGKLTAKKKSRLNASHRSQVYNIKTARKRLLSDLGSIRVSHRMTMQDMNDFKRRIPTIAEESQQLNIDGLLAVVAKYMLHLKYKRLIIQRNLDSFDSTKVDPTSVEFTAIDVKPLSMKERRVQYQIAEYDTTEKSNVYTWIKSYPVRYMKIHSKHQQVVDDTIQKVKLSKYEIERLKNDSRSVLDKKKGQRMLQICRKIRQLILKMKRLHISRDEFFSLKPFPNKPYEREHSEPFLKAAKKNDLKTVKSLLWVSKLLVHSFDWSNFTALHWAAKRGFSDMCFLLVKSGADLEAEDALERTALWYAIHTNNIECVFRLLSLGAVLPKKLQISKLQSSKIHTTITKVVMLLGLNKYIEPLLLNRTVYPSIQASTLYTIKQLESQFREEQEKNKKKT